MKNNKITRTGIIVAVLLLAVGFAAVTTILNITGTATVVPNNTDFETNLKFKTATADTGASAGISTDGKTVTFTTKQLSSIGDSSTLTYTIENQSQYAAVLGNITCAVADTDSAYAQYISITPSTNLNGATIARAATSAEGTVTVTMAKSYAEETAKSISFTCSIGATGQAA